jgi:hypothetical protein
MYFILTAAAAIVTTILWKHFAGKFHLGTLCLIYWGATLMWLVDHVIAYLQDGGAFFERTADATLLGITVVFSALLLWGVLQLLQNAKKSVFRSMVQRKQ